MELSALYRLFIRYPHIVTDSRHGIRDSVFFGLRGEHFNGSLYAKDALDNGSCIAVVDDPEVVRDERYILVPDSLKTLQSLAAYHRDRLDIPIIAITGSNGKTTTKELTSKILSTRYITKATTGNLNNHIGLPLTLLEMDSTTEIGIVEIGANHIGEIAYLCSLARPDYGLITNIGHAHLEGFGNLEGVKKAKGELYDYLNKNGGLIFCNGSDNLLIEMLENTKTGIRYYGESEESVCSGKILSSDPFLSISLSMKNIVDREMETRLVGNYNLQNVLAAVAVGLHFRIPVESIFDTLDGWSTDNNRSQRIETEKNILIMDAYNANPTSMMAALENFSILKHPGKVLILGDMLELGAEEKKSHQEILDFIPGMGMDEVFLVGPAFSGLELPRNIKSFLSVDELSIWLIDNPLSNRLILLKGSRGIGLERVKQGL